MNKIKYKCKKCNWQTAILEAWGDLKPSFCGNKKCLSNFSRNPDNLEVVFPELYVGAGIAVLLGVFCLASLTVSTALTVFWTVCGVGAEGIPAGFPVELT